MNVIHRQTSNGAYFTVATYDGMSASFSGHLSPATVTHTLERMRDAWSRDPANPNNRPERRK